MIIAEMKKAKPDLQVLKEKMNRTGTMRQKLCLEGTTAEVLDKFPALGLRPFVSVYFVYTCLSMCSAIWCVL